jgi:hypothetical protein
MLLSLSTAGPALARADRGEGGAGALKPQLVRVPTDVVSRGAVSVWTSEGDGARLFPGETVNVFFRTRQNAFVTVVNIDTRGRAHLLFPRGRDDGFVRAGRTVSIPERGASYKLQVSGPMGTERIIAFASDEPIGRHWRDLVADAGYGYEDRFGRQLDDRGGAWGAAASGQLGNVRIEVAAGRPLLVETPIEVDYCRSPIFRDETWFEVVRPGRGRF